MIGTYDSSIKLKQISIEEVEDNLFFKKLILVMERVYQSIGDINKNDYSLLEHMSPNEAYINDIFMMCRSLESCLKAIDYATLFISRYGTKDYKQKTFVPFDEFCLYHYDVICHKVATLKDLYFKLINKVYRLNLMRTTWKEIEKHKGKINNEQLFSILCDNFSLMDDLEKKRHKSSHDGDISMSILNDISLYLMVSSLQGKVPTIESDWRYNKDSILYRNKIKQAKNKVLEELDIVKYNAFEITKCFMCSLSSQFENLLTELFPHRKFEELRC